MKDKQTQQLLNGIHLLLRLYPNAKVRTGYDIGEIHVKGVDENILEDTKNQLEDWGWHLVYYEDKYFWEFDMRNWEYENE